MESNSISIKVKFFASLKDFCCEGHLELQTPKGVSAKLLMAEIEKKVLSDTQMGFADQSRFKKILLESVLASEESILSGDDIFQGSCEVALLPPVCGG